MAFDLDPEPEELFGDFFRRRTLTAERFGVGFPMVHAFVPIGATDRWRARRTAPGCGEYPSPWRKLHGSHPLISATTPR